MPVPNKEIFNDAYFKDKDILQPHLLMTLEAIIGGNGFRDILEVGCGTGRLLEALKKDGRRVLGCDISFSAAKKAGSLVADVNGLPFRSGRFDFLIGVSLIEHVLEADGKIFLTEAKRLLRKGGCLFLVTPNYAGPMRLIKGKNWFGYSDPTHVKFYTPGSLAKRMQENGFGDIRTTFSLKEYPDFNWGLPSENAAFNRFLSWLFIATPLARMRDSFWIMGRA